MNQPVPPPARKTEAIFVVFYRVEAEIIGPMLQGAYLIMNNVIHMSLGMCLVRREKDVMGVQQGIDPLKCVIYYNIRVKIDYLIRTFLQEFHQGLSFDCCTELHNCMLIDPEVEIFHRNSQFFHGNQIIKGFFGERQFCRPGVGKH